MPRKKNPDSDLTIEPETRAKLCELLESFGFFADPRGVAACFGLPYPALVYFLRSADAKAAIARHEPGTRNFAKRQTLIAAASKDPALLDGDLSGLTMHEMEPEHIQGALHLIKPDKANR